MHSPNPANIDYPALPPIHALRLREDGFVVHDAAVLRLPHATGVVRRHVGPDCDVMFTGHIDAASQPGGSTTPRRPPTPPRRGRSSCANWTQRAPNTSGRSSPPSSATRRDPL